MSKPLGSPGQNLDVIAGEDLYLGGAGFYIFDAADVETNAWMGSELLYQRLGYDCSAFVGTLVLEGACVGAVILPYGSWAQEYPELVDLLGRTDEGEVLPLATLLSTFPGEPLTGAHVRSKAGLIVCPFEDLEAALEDDEVVEAPVVGDMTVLVYSDDLDWVDGPVIVVRSDLLG